MESPRLPGPYVRATAYKYDARGKLLLNGDVVRFRDTVSATYTGLGNLSTALWIQHGCPYCDLADGWKLSTLERHTQDALANRTLNSLFSQQIQDAQNWSADPVSYDTLKYQPATGRLLREHHAANPYYVASRFYSYDEAGNIVFEQAVAPDTNTAASERASYFAADGTLRLVDSRWANTNKSMRGEHQEYTVEDYRYDALGRRVWMRAQKRCDDYSLTYRAGTECRVGFVRRTIWDGDQEVAEIQSPWDLEGYFAGYDTTQYKALADSDVTPMNFPHMSTWAGEGMDPNKFFGHVVYAGFRGMDHPIAITRVNYAWIMDWNFPTTVMSQVQYQAPFTIVPFWDMKGDAPQGMMSNGTFTLCNPSTDRHQCVAIQWPWDFTSTNRQGSLIRAYWHGSLLESKRDKSGLDYSRNRYYDPATGRFTQEDPIGLAGGLNLYGFAHGDPVNFTDPFGLCPLPLALADGPEPGPADVITLGICLIELKPAIDATIGRLFASVGTPQPTSRAARRAAMREQGIPTSQQPNGQRCDDKGNRQYDYEAGADATKVVTHHDADETHPLPHWEAGTMKDPAQYGLSPNGFRRYFNNDPKTGQPKSKCDYTP